MKLVQYWFKKNKFLYHSTKIQLKSEAKPFSTVSIFIGNDLRFFEPSITFSLKISLLIKDDFYLIFFANEFLFIFFSAIPCWDDFFVSLPVSVRHLNDFGFCLGYEPHL